MANTKDLIQIDDAAVLELDANLQLVIEHLEDDRVAAQRLALSAVARFLLRHVRWRQAALPLVSLENELPELLQPNPGGRPVSIANKRLAGYVGAVMDSLMKYGGRKKLEAARWVAERLTKAGWNVSPYTVVRWRDDAKKPQNAALHRSFRDGTNPAAWAGKDVDAYAAEIINRLILAHTPHQ